MESFLKIPFLRRSYREEEMGEKEREPRSLSMRFSLSSFAVCKACNANEGYRAGALPKFETSSPFNPAGFLRRSLKPKYVRRKSRLILSRVWADRGSFDANYESRPRTVS